MASNDIVTRLRAQRTNGVICGEAANEIERLRAERLEWFIVARQLRDAVGDEKKIDEAINCYLRTRGSLEDPRDTAKKVYGE